MRNRERERDSSLEGLKVYFSKNSVIVYCAFRFAARAGLANDYSSFVAHPQIFDRLHLLM